LLNFHFKKSNLNKKSFRTNLLYYIKDRNQPGSRRFELRSCKKLIVEQTKIIKLLHLNFILIQHRGHKQFYK